MFVGENLLYELYWGNIYFLKDQETHYTLNEEIQPHCFWNCITISVLMLYITWSTVHHQKTSQSILVWSGCVNIIYWWWFKDRRNRPVMFFCYSSDNGRMQKKDVHTLRWTSPAVLVKQREDTDLLLPKIRNQIMIRSQMGFHRGGMSSITYVNGI